MLIYTDLNLYCLLYIPRKSYPTFFYQHNTPMKMFHLHIKSVFWKSWPARWLVHNTLINFSLQNVELLEQKTSPCNCCFSLVWFSLFRNKDLNKTMNIYHFLALYEFGISPLLEQKRTLVCNPGFSRLKFCHPKGKAWAEKRKPQILVAETGWLFSRYKHWLCARELGEQVWSYAYEIKNIHGIFSQI